jgi:hypothetical protein
MDIKVHQYKGWLISKDKINKPEEFKQQTKVVCEIYKNAQHLEEKGTHVL